MAEFVIGVSIAFLAVLICTAIAVRNRSSAVIQHRVAPEEQYPPISDAEYFARCSPGVDPEVALKVRKIVAEYFGIPHERVHPSMTFVEDLGA